MNDIKAINGKLYLMPEFKEIPIDSVMGVMALIRSGKEHISYLNKQLEAEKNLLSSMEEMEKKGIDTAIESARLCRKDIEETNRALFRLNKELKDYEFSLEIAREKEKRTIIKEEVEKLGINSSELIEVTTFKKELSLTQIALIYIYKGDVITRNNGNQIAKKAGYISKTSGDKLYQNFTKYVSSADRKGDAGTKRKNQNKIKLIESIVELLPNDKQQRAKDEISILKSIQETQYQ